MIFPVGPVEIERDSTTAFVRFESECVTRHSLKMTFTLFSCCEASDDFRQHAYTESRNPLLFHIDKSRVELFSVLSKLHSAKCVEAICRVQRKKGPNSMHSQVRTKTPLLPYISLGWNWSRDSRVLPLFAYASNKKKNTHTHTVG